MSQFRPVTPQRAVEIVEMAGVTDAQRVIIDFACAGLVKGYALVSETVLGAAEPKSVRGAAIAPETWKRLQSKNVSAQVWRGGTVRLEPDPENGLPGMNITGVSFSEASLLRMVNPNNSNLPAVEEMARPSQPNPTATAPDAHSRLRPDPSSIPAGAKLVTVNQAMAMLGLGRTKINELMNDGRLERRKVDGRTLITVESVRKLAGD